MFAIATRAHLYFIENSIWFVRSSAEPSSKIETYGIPNEATGDHIMTRKNAKKSSSKIENPSDKAKLDELSNEELDKVAGGFTYEKQKKIASTLPIPEGGKDYMLGLSRKK